MNSLLHTERVLGHKSPENGPEECGYCVLTDKPEATALRVTGFTLLDILSSLFAPFP